MDFDFDGSLRPAAEPSRRRASQDSDEVELSGAEAALRSLAVSTSHADEVRGTADSGEEIRVEDFPALGGGRQHSRGGSVFGAGKNQGLLFFHPFTVLYRFIQLLREI